MNSSISQLKKDKSAFTIADGLVQNILTECLFAHKFKSIVSEEQESTVNIKKRPYFVDNMVVPEEFYGHIDVLAADIMQLAEAIDGTFFRDVTVIIDPIDGTREFATGLGEQCSICIGLADITGKVIAGLVYRPLSGPITFAAACLSEKFTMSNLDSAATPSSTGFLTTNGAISKFTEALIEELGFVRVRAGGAGKFHGM